MVVDNEISANACISILSSKYANRKANFNVTAIDPSYTGETDGRSTVEVIVNIEDINDNPPEFERTSATVRFMEDDFTTLPVSDLIYMY